MDEYIIANELRPGPDPLYRQSLALENLGNIDGAIRLWNTILIDYPGNRYTQEINDRLDRNNP